MSLWVVTFTRVFQPSSCCGHPLALARHCKAPTAAHSCFIVTENLSHTNWFVIDNSKMLKWDIN